MVESEIALSILEKLLSMKVISLTEKRAWLHVTMTATSWQHGLFMEDATAN
jgi:hypothetical protein